VDVSVKTEKKGKEGGGWVVTEKGPKRRTIMVQTGAGKGKEKRTGTSRKKSLPGRMEREASVAES